MTETEHGDLDALRWAMQRGRAKGPARDQGRGPAEYEAKVAEARAAYSRQQEEDRQRKKEAYKAAAKASWLESGGTEEAFDEHWEEIYEEVLHARTVARMVVASRVIDEPSVARGGL
ncbi:MAG TPA: hypothetical protein VMY40_10075 [Anaerolineae bacterium]|nr:hypothetical protein [Anaerolineae bacterium]